MNAESQAWLARLDNWLKPTADEMGIACIVDAAYTAFVQAAESLATYKVYRRDGDTEYLDTYEADDTRMQIIDSFWHAYLDIALIGWRVKYGSQPHISYTGLSQRSGKP